jgi:hypothetical protein
VTCERFEEQAAELALGQLDHPDRAELLDHAAGCVRCGQLLGDLSTVCDRMLHFAPQIEPPTGFEAKAVAAMGGGGEAVGPSRRRVVGAVAVVAVAAVVLLLVGVVVGRATDPSGSSDAEVAAGRIVSFEGSLMGTAELEQGPVDRIVLTLEGDPSWDGVWTC